MTFLDFVVQRKEISTCPIFIRTVKVQLLKSKENRTKGFSGSQLSLSPLNTKCFWLPVRDCSQVTIPSLFPSPLLFKEGIAYKMWPLVCVWWWGVSPAPALSPSLSLFLHAPNFFFPLWKLPRKQSLLCSNFIWAIRFAGNLHKSWREKEGCNVLLTNVHGEHIFLEGVIISCWVCRGALQIPLTR